LSTNFDTISVNLPNNRAYPIYIGKHGLSDIGGLLRKAEVGKKVLIVSNATVLKHHGTSIQDSLSQAGYEHISMEIPEGETHKTLDTVSKIIDKLVGLRLERGDTLVALGGGVIGDTAGFASSIYLRGIHLVQCPTSLLAQVDAAVGGKTGVNHQQGKNLIGTFYQPEFVLIDPETLSTLPDQEMRCGLAEIVKYGVIQDKILFEYLEQKADTLSSLSYAPHQDIWLKLITQSCRNKAEVVAQDETEKGLRETLNFGHTIGHALEAATRYEGYLHGEAVAIGMRAAAYLAMRLQLFSKTDYSRLQDLLHKLGFTLSIPEQIADTLFPHLFSDKKIQAGKLRFVLPTHIGNTTTRSDLSADLIREGLAELKS